MNGSATLRFVTLLMLASVAPVRAQTATQRVTFQVIALNRMAVSSAGTYTITTNERHQKIAAALDDVLPDGVTLEVSLSAPPGASSVGLVPLGTSGVDVVTGITPIASSALPMSYRLSASHSVVRPRAPSRVVTYTILSAP